MCRMFNFDPSIFSFSCRMTLRHQEAKHKTGLDLAEHSAFRNPVAVKRGPVLPLPKIKRNNPS